MRSTWLIARRELGAQFRAPLAYIVVAAFSVLTSLLFFDDFFVARVARLDGMFNSLPLLFLFFAPALAMRTLAEERGRGTIEVLLTMPVRDWEVVVGKYLAALALMVIGLAATLPIAVTVARLGELDTGPVIGGYLGATLLGATYLAVGLFASALTRDQVVAFVVGLIICFGIYALNLFAANAGDTLGPILQYASPQFHFHNMTRGLLEPRSLVYFGSFIAAFLLLSIQVLESRKWR